MFIFSDRILIKKIMVFSTRACCLRKEIFFGNTDYENDYSPFAWSDEKTFVRVLRGLLLISHEK